MQNTKIQRVEKELLKIKKSGKKDIYTKDIGLAANLPATTVGLYFRDFKGIVRIGNGHWRFL
jgi:hypothetical protein